MRFAFFALAAIFLLPVLASAQSTGGLGDVSGEPFGLSVTPQYPAPYSQIAVSLTSGEVNINDVTSTVWVNGKQTYSGAAHAFAVMLGAAGAATTVRVQISVDGMRYEKSVTVEPQDVVLIAEPVASAPPLYPGKPSVPLNGNVRLVALANLKGASNPSSYSYVWTVDDVQMLGSSGIGRSNIIVPSPLEYRASNVSVVVSDRASRAVGSASLTLSAVEPTIRVYENDPLLGIRFDHALLGGYTISGAESTLYAAPFSLPITTGAPFVQWFLGGTIAQTGNSVTLRPAGSGQGRASLSVTASGGSSSAHANLNLVFGLPKSSNFFGL